MKRTSIVVVSLALAACLSGCKPETIGPGANSDQTGAHAPRIALPPAIKASRVYRCKDESLIYVDFLTDGVTADLRMKETGPIIRLQAPEPGAEFTGGGYALNGSGDAVELTKHGKPAERCRA